MFYFMLILIFLMICICYLIDSGIMIMDVENI